MDPTFNTELQFHVCRDIDPISNTTCQFYVFLRILSPCSRFSKTCWTDFQDVGPVFSIFQTFRYPTLYILKYLGVSKIWIIGFGSHGHVPKCRNHEIYRFSGFLERTSKKRLIQNRIILRSVWAQLV